MTKDTGGQAFPMMGHECDFRGVIPTEYGMTLRQWYAGMALQGLLAHYGYGDCTKDEIAFDAGQLADAMIRDDKK